MHPDDSPLAIWLGVFCLVFLESFFQSILLQFDRLKQAQNVTFPGRQDECHGNFFQAIDPTKDDRCPKCWSIVESK